MCSPTVPLSVTFILFPPVQPIWGIFDLLFHFQCTPSRQIQNLTALCMWAHMEARGHGSVIPQGLSAWAFCICVCFICMYVCASHAYGAHGDPAIGYRWLTMWVLETKTKEQPVLLTTEPSLQCTTLFLRQGLSLAWNWPRLGWLGWRGSKHQQWACLCLPGTGITCACHHACLTCVLGIELCPSP